jgi:serine-type D-Ala-D-Ala carboxypeptidase
MVLTSVCYGKKLSAMLLILLGLKLSFYFFQIQDLSAQPVSKPDPVQRFDAVVDSIIQSQVDRDKIPGAVILVTKDGKTVLRKAYGYALKYDYDHNPVVPPEMMTPEHLFDLASLTKVVGTTTSIMLLVDRGLVRVDDPVCKYIKGFDTPEKRNITLRNLLTHTAGLWEWYPLYYFASTREQCYHVIDSLPLRRPVGVKRSYSDLGFDKLAEIVESVSGMPIDRFMEENIFIPLGMTSTLFNPLEKGGFDKIAATSPGNPTEWKMVHDPGSVFRIKSMDPDNWNGWRHYLLRGEVNDGNAWYANKGISGAAGLFSTADDIQKLVTMLLNKGKTGNGQFLSSDVINSFIKQDKFRNGLGWMMDPALSFMKNAPAGSFGHTGFTGTSISVVPSKKVSVILLINRLNMGLLPTGDFYGVTTLRLQVFGAVRKYLLSQAN